MLVKLTTARLSSGSFAVALLFCMQTFFSTGCNEGKTYSYDSSKSNGVKGGLTNPYASTQPAPSAPASSNQGVSNPTTPIPDTGSVGTDSGTETGGATADDGAAAGGTAALDGLALYTTNCEGCHGAKGGNINNRTALGTTGAIKSIPVMASLKLSDDVIDAIADAIK